MDVPLELSEGCQTNTSAVRSGLFAGDHITSETTVWFSLLLFDQRAFSFAPRCDANHFILTFFCLMVKVNR